MEQQVSTPYPPSPSASCGWKGGNSGIQLLVFVLIGAGSLFLNFAPMGSLVVTNQPHYSFPPNAAAATSHTHSQTMVTKVLQSNSQLTNLPTSGVAADSNENDVITSSDRTKPPKPQNPSTSPLLSPPSKVRREDCTNYGKKKDPKLEKMTVASVQGRLNSTLNAPYIRKQQVQGRPRVLFVAGLEGTGHHLVDASLRGVCVPFDAPSRVNCRASSAMHSVVGGCSVNWNFDKMRSPEGKEKFMRQLKNEASATDELVVINSLRPKNVFFNAQSYPDCSQPRINGQFPDIRLLAEYLEEAGMDFRVIVMHRQVIDSFLVSITVKRHFAPSFDANIVTAYQMLTYLLAQISVIDPKFIAGCFHLDMDKEEFSQVMNKVDHALNTTLFSTRMVNNFRQHSSNSCINESQFSEVWMQRLIEKWDEMRRFCYQFVTQKPPDQVSM